MVSVREHVDWLYGSYFVFYVEELEVACLSGWVAAHVYDATRFGIEDDVDHVFVHACARWVGDDYIWAAVFLDEAVGENIFHVASKEERVVDAIERRVHLGILNSFGHVLDADDLACLARHEVGYGTSAGVEVIDEFVACESGKVACYLI